jgi:aryl-alcohol dehydrogenase-like predicted oxidoreductase
MQYRSLGRSGITVSSVCLGTMTFGEQTREDESHRMMDLARDAGVTFFDAAEVYPVPQRAATYGETERHIGRWLKAQGGRDRLVLATKVVGRTEGRMPYLRGGITRLDRRHITEAVEGSLKRLQTDYIDLYQTHFPDRQTNTFEKLGYQHDPKDRPVPLEETLAVLADLRKAGKIRAFGASNETPWGLMTLLRRAEENPALPRCAAIQNPYSLLNRGFDVGLAEVSIREECPLMAYSPLAFGTLTGKYADGSGPAEARLNAYRDNPAWARYHWPRVRAAAKAYIDLARKHGLPPIGMALAYVMSRPFVASTIVGARTADQLRENLALAESTALGPEAIAGIEAIHAENPNPLLK